MGVLHGHPGRDHPVPNTMTKKGFPGKKWERLGLGACNYNEQVTEEKVLESTEHKKTLRSSQSETHRLTQHAFNPP